MTIHYKFLIDSVCTSRCTFPSDAWKYTTDALVTNEAGLSTVCLRRCVELASQVFENAIAAGKTVTNSSALQTVCEKSCVFSANLIDSLYLHYSPLKDVCVICCTDTAKAIPSNALYEVAALLAVLALAVFAYTLCAKVPAAKVKTS